MIVCRARVLGLLLALCCSGAAAATLSIRADEWYPINAEPGSDMPGLMIEMASALLAGSDDRVDYALSPWDTALADARSGKIDCVVGALKSEADGLVTTQRPWLQSEQTLYALTDRKLSYTGFADLPSLRVAIIDGYSYGPELDAYIADNRGNQDRIVVIPDSSRAQRELLMRLMVAHADVILETAVVMDAAISRYGRSGQIRRLSPVFPGREREDLYIACNQDNPRVAAVITRFDQGYAQLQSSGELSRLRARYGLQ